MNKSVYAIAIIAAIAATATALQQNADAALYTDALHPISQPAPFGFPAQLTSYSDGSQLDPSWFAAPLTSFGEVSEPKFSADPLQFSYYGSPSQFKALEEPRQPLSLEQPEKSTQERAARQSRAPIVRIGFNAPVLAPMAHTRFCLQFPDECKVHKIVFRGGAIKLSAARHAELVKVNAEVNRSITPEANKVALPGAMWLISPTSGDCNDYAVTKRHQLIARGWPARALLLAEVVTSWGEHHLVLVVRTSEGDLVADNLNANIRSWSKTSYEWVRIQSPRNPKFWSTVTNVTV